MLAVAIVLLPALLGRALIPAGFMVMAGDDGRMTIVLCPGEFDAPAPTSAADPHAHHHHGDVAGHPSHSKGHFTCPFALSASPVSLPVLLAVVSPVPVVVQATEGGVATVFLPTVIRAQSSRAPPAHA